VRFSATQVIAANDDAVVVDDRSRGTEFARVAAACSSNLSFCGPSRLSMALENVNGNHMAAAFPFSYGPGPVHGHFQRWLEYL
jgi:hypothetical protein